MDPKNMRILIADDESLMCELIRGMLKLLGYGKKHYYAPNGLSALNILKKNTIDLAIIDWNMPVMDGIELLRSIRGHKEYRHLPVLMVTGEASSKTVIEAAKEGIDAYILKPLSAESMEEKLSSVLAKTDRSPAI